ncbi:MAG: metal-dependent hydrolase [Bacteroidales bacterium]|nr:metal-dependent hydrolase [Bacteroidales bacterium]
MDSLTQAVLGAAVAEATIGRKEGNKSVLLGVIIGTIPDLDVFIARFFDPVQRLLVHRGFSHSILLILLLTPLIGILLTKIYPRSGTSLRRWILMVFLVLGTHVLLDLFTTYGTGLFEPFSHYRVEWSTIAIVDLLYTVPLLLSILLLMFFKRTSGARRIIGRAGLIISTCYLLLTVVNKQYINSRFKNQLSGQQIAYTELKTIPMPLTNFLWMGIARQNDDYHTGYYSVFDEHDTIRFSSFRRNELLILPLLKDKRVKNLIRFTKGYYSARFDKGELVINDLRFGRFGLDNDSPWIFAFRISSDGNNLEVYEADNSEAMTEEVFARFIKRIFGDTSTLKNRKTVLQ